MQEVQQQERHRHQQQQEEEQEKEGVEGQRGSGQAGAEPSAGRDPEADPEAGVCHAV